MRLSVGCLGISAVACQGNNWVNIPLQIKDEGEKRKVAKKYLLKHHSKNSTQPR